MDRQAWRRSLLAALCASLILPTAAAAALPVAGARFEVHDHKAKGAAWHVELEVARRDRAVLRIVVLYDEACGETIAAERVRLTPEGVLDASGAFTATDGKGGEQPGTWELDAQFVSPHQVEGTFRILEPGCEASKTFVGHHGGGHRHLTKLGYPDVAGAKPAARAEARRMLRRVREVAARRFPTIERARAAGFDRYVVNRRTPAPGVFHLWSRAYNDDDHRLDAERPESLVYFKPVDPKAEPVLLAFMLRVGPGRPPRFAGNIPVWHNHARGGPKMIHVWLTPNLRAAYANCLPVPALERSLRPFTFDDVPSRLHEAQPCPEDSSASTGAAVRVGDS